MPLVPPTIRQLRPSSLAGRITDRHSTQLSSVSRLSLAKGSRKTFAERKATMV